MAGLRLNPATGLFEPTDPVAPDFVVPTESTAVEQSPVHEDVMKDTVEASTLKVSHEDVMKFIEELKTQKRAQLTQLLRHSGLDTQQQEKMFKSLSEMFGL